MIARQIHVSLVPGEGQPRLSRAPDPAAYQLYLQARYELNDGSERSVRTSLGHFQEAIHRDPAYARAWAGSARGHVFLALYPHYDAPAERMPKARDAAAKAIELDPSLAEAHVSLAWINMFYDWNWDKAAQELRRAIDLNPNLAEAYEAYSSYYTTFGRFDDAWRAASRAVELSPLDLNSSFQLQLILLETKRYSESIALGRKLLEREPRAAGIRAFVGLSAVLSGHADEGIRELEKAAEIGEAPSFRLFLALGLALSGRTDQSRDILRAMEATSKRKYICPYEIASVHAALGEKEDAFQWLRKGLAERCACMVWLKVEPWLDSIRSDPRYFDLLHSTGIDTAQPPVFTP